MKKRHDDKRESTNFRDIGKDILFDHNVRKEIFIIYDLCHNKDNNGLLSEEVGSSKTEAEEGELQTTMGQKALGNLQIKLNQYYKLQGNSKEDAKIRAKETYSEFLQHLVYYLAHAVIEQGLVGTKEINQMLSFLIEQKLFFYCHSGVTVWIDPKEGSTALHPLALYGDIALTKQLIVAAEKAFGGYNTPQFKDFLTYGNKDCYSPLNAACKTGHIQIVIHLLDVAKKTFGGEDTPEYKNFLEQENKDGVTPLNAVCGVFFYEKRSEYERNKDKKNKNTPAKPTDMRIIIIKLLIDKGANPYKEDVLGFSAALYIPKKDISILKLDRDKYEEYVNKLRKLNPEKYEPFFIKKGEMDKEDNPVPQQENRLQGKVYQVNKNNKQQSVTQAHSLYATNDGQKRKTIGCPNVVEKKRPTK